MIDFLRGKVALLEADYIVLDVRDIGYRVFTPNPYAFAGSEDTITVYIHHHVREDAILLYGFSTRHEQTLFRKLIEVSGIGPRVALGILSGGQPDNVIMAIQQENIAFLTKLPGIGKKTAQRMILDLKDKLLGLGGDEGLLAKDLFGEPHAIASSDNGHEGWSEAREALAALGYKAAELDKAWAVLQEKVDGSESVEALMKLAFQQLVKG
ncbi:Holliday junction branch migration protein RuvA [Paenibacillus sp. GXUN7292]|uniref:Holliday junction branch migration protein RuvA n=1 Tax=Paenibacillus sp. GXUN7292 TaxID=3422499 RepID=UPI003D7D9FBA